MATSAVAAACQGRYDTEAAHRDRPDGESGARAESARTKLQEAIHSENAVRAKYQKDRAWAVETDSIARAVVIGGLAADQEQEVNGKNI